MKTKLSFGGWDMSVSTIMLGILTDYTCRIDRVEGDIYCDNLGNRYVPYPSPDFEDTWYIVVSPFGGAAKLLYAELIEK